MSLLAEFQVELRDQSECVWVVDGRWEQKKLKISLKQQWRVTKLLESKTISCKVTQLQIM